MAKIQIEVGGEDAWICGCGNTSVGDGFYPCDENGNDMEPVTDWSGLYRCDKCGAIIDQESLEIVAEAGFVLSGRFKGNSGVVEKIEPVVQPLK